MELFELRRHLARAPFRMFVFGGLRLRKALERVERPELGGMAVPARLAICESDGHPSPAAEFRVVAVDPVEAQRFERVVEEFTAAEPLASVELEEVRNENAVKRPVGPAACNTPHARNGAASTVTSSPRMYFSRFQSETSGA